MSMLQENIGGGGGGGGGMSTLQYIWEDYVHLYNVGQARFFSEAILSYTLPSENK